MAPPAPFVFTIVTAYTVSYDSYQRSEIRKAAPESVISGDVGCVKLACSCGPEALAWVVKVPDVKVAYLRSFWRREAEYVAGGNAQGVAGARWNGVTEDLLASSGLRDRFIEFFVDGWR